MIRRLLCCAALLLALTAAPAMAGSKTLDLQLIAAQTATGTGGAIAVDNLRELMVYVDCTTSSGTGVLDLYLQSSSDGGVTWYDVPYETRLYTPMPANATEGHHATPNISSASGTADIGARDLLDGVSSCSTEQRSVGIYRTFGNYVRVAWVVTVTSAPSYTFSVKAVGKT